MKVAQNDETNPDMQPVRPPHIPSIANTQLFPLRFICPKTRNTGDTFPDVSPFASITYHCVRTRLALSVVLLCTCLLCFFFFPLFSPVDYETDTAAAQFDYVDDDPSSLSAELPGKPPFDHPGIAHSILSCLHRFCYCN